MYCPLRFSILLRIELVFGACQPWCSRSGTRTFQYPLADRVGFWGSSSPRRCAPPAQFQYPLADRVGFWGSSNKDGTSNTARFSILLRIELVFGVALLLVPVELLYSFSILLRIELVFGAETVIDYPAACKVSVSSCGSSWFLGRSAPSQDCQRPVFQYPLADRVGFWGCPARTARR